MLIKAEDLADGRWPEILCAAGVDMTFFSGRQGPCPFCGGKDRYRFQNKEGGRYVCSQCTDSKWRGGFDLLMRHMGYSSFRLAADHVREFFNQPGSSVEKSTRRPLPAQRVVSSHDDRAKREKSIARMLDVWNSARPVTWGDPVDQYLRRRVSALTVVSDQIRYHPDLPYWDAPETLGGRPILLGHYPAMLVRGFDAADNLVQLHKTYLTADGLKADVPHPKKTDVGVGSNSFALRLDWPKADTLGVCEGIETAIASALLRPDVTVWPCHSSSILANFEIPESLKSQIKRVIIFADADDLKNGKRAGQIAAARLADRLRKEGVRSLIVRPAKVGTDMADLAALYR